MDDEHRLIARYVERLATLDDSVDFGSLGGGGGGGGGGVLASCQVALTHDQRRQLVHELEAKNRAILREIQRLRLEQQETAAAGGYSPSLSDQLSLQHHYQQQQQQQQWTSQCSPHPVHHQLAAAGNQLHQQLQLVPSGGWYTPPPPQQLVDELRLLRRRRDELEGRMLALQSSRRDLMTQLETLMTVLKSRSTTPSSSSRSPHSTVDFDQPPAATGAMAFPNCSCSPPPALALVTGDIQHAFADSSSSFHFIHQGAAADAAQPQQSSRGGLLSRDLVEATDYVTGAVTSLVRELNSDDIAEGVEYCTADQQQSSVRSFEDAASGPWPVDKSFLAELRRHRLFRSADNRHQSQQDELDSPVGSRDNRLYDNGFQLLQVPSTRGGVVTSQRGVVVATSDAESCGGVGGVGDADPSSYLRIDDAEDDGTATAAAAAAGCSPTGTDWEEARRRWINR
jgi:hypothetical protein